jgi:Nucleotidyl transferase of unknown function (DUF2204)
MFEQAGEATAAMFGVMKVAGDGDACGHNGDTREEGFADVSFKMSLLSSPPAVFYQRSMEILDEAGILFLVGGAYAIRAHAGIERDTKDFDVMLQQKDVHSAIQAFREAGYRAEVAFPHWIAKAHHGELFLDLIYNSGNGLCPVDDEWFANARTATVLGREVKLCPAEEIIWQKAFIMERERFDGADIVHLLRSCKGNLDWPRLLRRFGSDGRVLLAHLLLAQFVYPGIEDIVPEGIVSQLSAQGGEKAAERLCNGSLLSRAQYLPDIERWDFLDARISRGLINETDLAIWTAAIPSEVSP